MMSRSKSGSMTADFVENYRQLFKHLPEFLMVTKTFSLVTQRPYFNSFPDEPGTHSSDFLRKGVQILASGRNRLICASV